MKRPIPSTLIPRFTLNNDVGCTSDFLRRRILIVGRSFAIGIRQSTSRISAFIGLVVAAVVEDVVLRCDEVQTPFTNPVVGAKVQIDVQRAAIAGEVSQLRFLGNCWSNFLYRSSNDVALLLSFGYVWKSLNFVHHI